MIKVKLYLEHVLCEEMQGELDLFSLEQRWLLTEAHSAYGEVFKEMEPGSSQQCRAGRSETTGIN